MFTNCSEKKKVVYIFTVYCEYFQNSSVFLQSCIIWIASTLFCFSVCNKHFLKHSTASEFEKNFLILTFIFLIAATFIFERKLSNNAI